MASQDNISIDDVRRAMSDPLVRNSRPEELIKNLAAVLNIDDVPTISQEESERIRNEYFQAVQLDKDSWTSMPGLNNFVQIHPFKLKQIPKDTHFVADVLIDKSDYEAECYHKYIRNMMIRGKNIVFSASAEIPVTITLGLKCVSDITDLTVRVPDACFKDEPK